MDDHHKQRAIIESLCTEGEIPVISHKWLQNVYVKVYECVLFKMRIKCTHHLNELFKHFVVTCESKQDISP